MARALTYASTCVAMCLAIAVPSSASAVCDESAATFRDARALAHTELNDIYGLQLAEISFPTDIPKGRLDETELGPEFAELIALASEARVLHGELEILLGIVEEHVNPFIRKRRSIPPVIVSGADYSRCLALLETAESERLFDEVAKGVAEATAARLEGESGDRLRAALENLEDNLANSGGFATERSAERGSARSIEETVVGVSAAAGAFPVVFLAGEGLLAREEFADRALNLFGRELDFGISQDDGGQG